MRVLALDLSLTSTGLADDTGAWRITTDLRGPERLNYLGLTILSHVIGAFGDGFEAEWQRPDLVAIENYASSRFSAYPLGEQGGIVRRDLWAAGVPFVDVDPQAIKTYATGKGNGSKDEVLANAIRRLGYTGHNKDESDALWLHALVKDALGEPVVKMPETHRKAVPKVAALIKAIGFVAVS